MDLRFLDMSIILIALFLAGMWLNRQFTILERKLMHIEKMLITDGYKYK